MVSASAFSQSVKRKYCAASEQVAKNLLISCMWEELAWDARRGSARIPMEWKWICRRASVWVCVWLWWLLLCCFWWRSNAHKFEQNETKSQSWLLFAKGQMYGNISFILCVEKTLFFTCHMKGLQTQLNKVLLSSQRICKLFMQCLGSCTLGSRPKDW